MFQRNIQYNLEEHVYAFVPRASHYERISGNLEILNVNIHNILESRCFIKGSGIILTASFEPPDWGVITPRTPAVFVRIPDNNRILAGLLHYVDNNDILPEWVL